MTYIRDTCARIPNYPQISVELAEAATLTFIAKPSIGIRFPLIVPALQRFDLLFSQISLDDLSLTA